MGLLDTFGKEPVLAVKKVSNPQLEKFKNMIEKKYSLKFDSHWDVHKWSVDNFEIFWKELWHYLDIITSKTYDKVFVKTGNGFLDNDWFSGARFNIAENLLRIRDDRVALICTGEEDAGKEETVTYSKMFEEVKLYSSALRRHGLKVGDTIACLMDNRKEALFVMLAATSIGAIFGGPLPLLGARAQSTTIKNMESKILILVDHFQLDGMKYSIIDNLSTILESAPNLEKVVILSTKKETQSRLSDMPKSILLEDFLQSGRNPDKTVPDLVFEQLPFNHPYAINFTSGTTGAPKGIVHSAGSFIAILRDFVLHRNIESGDAVYLYCPVGWSVWNDNIPCIAYGVKLLLYKGTPHYNVKENNVWNLFSKYKVKYAMLSPSQVDIQNKMNIIPDPDANLETFQLLGVGGAPVKRCHYEYLHNTVKKDLFIECVYGATESFGCASGFYFNAPTYVSECMPALGVDLHCFNRKGESVVGQRGDLVVKTPSPSLPICLWKDEDNSKLNETYFSKHEGVWCQNDEGWINPETKGIIVIGRSDNIVKTEEGERFSSSDVYFAIEYIEELADAICVPIANTAVLFIQLKEGNSFSPRLKEKILNVIKKELYVEYLPELIIEVPDIPYNMNGKKMESLVKKIAATNLIPEVTNIKNPDCLQYFCNIPELIDYQRKV